MGVGTSPTILIGDDVNSGSGTGMRARTLTLSLGENYLKDKEN